jgi:hypothetical protein
MPSLDALKAFLSNPAAFATLPGADAPPDDVTLRQTHISLVALAGDHVVKIKKPVDFGFLDFSTLAKRRARCHDEVRLNRRLCPAIYRGVVPLHAEGETFVFGDPVPEGEAPARAPVEWAVVMDRLPRAGFLDHRLATGDATPADIDRLADRLADFYARQDADAHVAEAGWPANVRTNFDENFEQTAPFVGDLIAAPAFRALRYHTDRVFDQEAARLHRRRASGRIVDGHGDLRLEHVHLTGEGVCIYDCIEFNERFRHLDVASDVAFLAMELDVAGHAGLARRFLRRMADLLHDDGLLALADFYRSYRAFVRGKVHALRAGEDEVEADDRTASRDEAQTLFRWALRYAVAGAAPLVVVVMGRPGTGKSTQAEAVADALGFAVVSSDRVRKQRAGVPLTERPDAATRERLYDRSMSDAVYGHLRATALERAEAGDGTVLDATYSRRARRDALRTALADAGVPYAVVELTADAATLRDRLAARTDDALVSDARAEDFSMLDARYEPPDALEDARHVRVPTTADDPEATTEAVLRALVRLADA